MESKNPGKIIKRCPTCHYATYDEEKKYCVRCEEKTELGVNCPSCQKTIILEEEQIRCGSCGEDLRDPMYKILDFKGI
jgi:hypothetical protein